MNDRALPIQPIQLWKEHQSSWITERAYFIGILLALFGALIDFAWGSSLFAFAELLAANGFFLSLLRHRMSHQIFRGRDHSAYMPGYLSAWLVYLPLVYSNAVFWCLLKLTGYQDSTYPIPPVVVFGKFIALSSCVFAYIVSLIRSQDFLIKELLHRNLELNEARTHLAHTAKMAEIGNLIATTVHELGQPVQTLSTATALLTQVLEEQKSETRTKKIRQLTEWVNESINRIVGLTNQLRIFSRKEQNTEPTILENIDISQTLSGVLRLTQYDFDTRKIGYKQIIPDDPVMALGDSSKIQQILFNLLNNARDACANEQSPLVAVQIHRWKKWVRVSIQNNGPAIPSSIQKKLFTPYFTTKAAGKGTGLGLTICEQLIKDLGGRIFFSSDHNSTVFVVDLPVALPTAQDKSIPIRSLRNPTARTIPVAITHSARIF